jgi:DNA (cytosine-5)-methyltransferase 1
MVDLFSGGGGGWDLGARSLGVPSIGIEWGGPECATRAAVGLATIRADVSQYPPERFVGRVEGVCGSPPCQAFSSAGKRQGLADPRGQMVHEPMRWVRVIRPRWVALEQVPEVLGYWRWISRELRDLGYSAWCGVLNAADYGVPQVRKRAVLLASLDRVAAPPAPTHSKHGHADLLGESLLPWVSMAAALGWDGVVHTQTQTGSADERHEYVRTTDRPSSVVRTNSVGRWALQGNQKPGGTDELIRRGVDEPSITISTKGNSYKWLRSPGRSYGAPSRRADATTDPAPTIALGHNASSWCWERPATTVMGDQRVFPPGGHHPGNGTDPKSWSSNAIPVEPWELGVLQGFPADHPWQAPHVSRQIGNAIPPPLAEACLRAITGRQRAEVAA